MKFKHIHIFFLSKCFIYFLDDLAHFIHQHQNHKLIIKIIIIFFISRSFK